MTSATVRFLGLWGLVLGTGLVGHAQLPTWVDDIAPIVQSLSVQHVAPGAYVLSVQSEVGQRDVATVVVQR
ncbi:MAG: hypothetical protein VXZ16_03220 [Bacteroidota bacterium]|nr:hypothetical protein [Bacteroidota bacterium]